MITYNCPVCGYDQLTEPPYDNMGVLHMKYVIAVALNMALMMTIKGILLKVTVQNGYKMVQNGSIKKASQRIGIQKTNY